METQTTGTHGVFARLRSRLRGDRYMVGADAPSPAVPEPAPAATPVAAAPPPAKEG